jgi:PAS domain S-box-containing protein
MSKLRKPPDCQEPLIPQRGTRYDEDAEDVLDSAPCGFLSMLPDGIIVRANGTILAWTGYTREKMLAGVRFQDLLTVPGRIFYETQFAPLLRMQGFVKEIACHLRRIGNEPLPVLVNASLKLDDNGEPLVIRTAVFDATNRTKYEQELRTARKKAEQLAAIVACSKDAIISSGLDRVVLTWNDGASQLFGFSAADVLGRRLSDLIVPESLREQDAEIHETVRRNSQSVLMETERRHKDGSLLPVEMNASPIVDADGHVTATSLIFRDLRERNAAERRLREGEERFRLAIKAANALVYDVDLRDNRVEVFGLEEVTGYRAKISELTSRWWHERIHPDDLPAYAANIEAFMATGGRYGFEYRVRHASGGWIWVREDAEVFLETDATPSRIVGTIASITERKRAEEQIRLLMQEVNHRAKNLLSVVQAIAHQTARSGDPATFPDRLSERLRALAANHDLLVNNAWRGIDVATLVRAQLSPFGDLIGSRITLEGPPLRLNPSAAQGLGMALHELATNASKYGALSIAAGSVRVQWAMTAADAPMFAISWREANGPPVSRPTRRGFGQTVIGPMMQKAVQGTVAIDYQPSGLVWRLTGPAHTTLERALDEPDEPDR